MTNAIQNRHDFVLLFDVKNGNPNGGYGHRTDRPDTILPRLSKHFVRKKSDFHHISV